MAYYRTCSHCGSNLDPGEICDCEQKKKEKECKCDGDDRGKIENQSGRDTRVSD